MAKLNASNIGPMNNLLINGDFIIAQRGISHVSPSHGDYTLDRFIFYETGDAVVTITQDTDVPTFAQSGHDSVNSLKVDCTTADAVIADSAYSCVAQPIEGFNMLSAIGKVVTLSFWVKSTITGTYCVVFKNVFADMSYVVEYTISASNTWEKKTISVTLPSTDTWNQATLTGLRLYWTLFAGADYQVTAAETWESGTLLGTSNQVNALSSTSNNFLLSQVKLEIGSVATPFIHRPIAEELALCQRYWEKSYIDTKYPGNPDTEGMLYARSSGTTFLETIPFKVTKRTNVTPYGYSPSTGTVGYVYDYTTGGDVAYSAITAGDNSMYVLINSVTDAHSFGMQWVADAEL